MGEAAAAMRDARRAGFVRRMLAGLVALVLLLPAAAAADAGPNPLAVARDLRRGAELMRDAVALEFALTEASRWFDDVLATGIDGGEAAMNARAVQQRALPAIADLEARLRVYAPGLKPRPPLYPLRGQSLRLLADYPAYLRRLSGILAVQAEAAGSADTKALESLAESWLATSEVWFDRFYHVINAELAQMPTDSPEHFALRIAAEDFRVARAERRLVEALDPVTARARLITLGEAQERFGLRVAAARAAAEALMPAYRDGLARLFAPLVGETEAAARADAAMSVLRAQFALYDESVAISRARLGLFFLWTQDPQDPGLPRRWAEISARIAALSARLGAAQVAYFTALAPPEEDP
ncbi:hypothetical protein LNKW23_29820 [Paralimibaculum aggregatum]|uniref:DUF3829 domain-containing protein n=1 Tax=Paralimibaculum aggregatum TaxID=3036245 RepID=A0ABQ6LR12_9RHOB|nr:hypothetical protein [Limibaculum sp. NKW23]GMG83768.1 hypothetical protein LNKW23_29820 [Limibaculum sp. NKW23]